jgi:Resolvase, N terminal domain
MATRHHTTNMLITSQHVSIVEDMPLDTSTVTQEAGLEAQERDLKAAGVEKLFTEQVSSVADREQLEAALDYAREGDVMVVTKLDRLARSIRDLCSIVDRLTAKGVSLRILGMGRYGQRAVDAQRPWLRGSVRA